MCLQVPLLALVVGLPTSTLTVGSTRYCLSSKTKSGCTLGAPAFFVYIRLLLLAQVLNTNIAILQTFAMTQETDVATLVEKTRVISLVYSIWVSV